MEKKEKKSEDRPLIRYEKLRKKDLVDYCRVYWRRIHNDEMLFNDIYKDIESLKSDVSVYKSQMNAYKKKYLALLKANTELKEENKKLKLENADLMWERDWLKIVVERLHKEIEELEKPHPKFSDFWWYDE